MNELKDLNMFAIFFYFFYRRYMSCWETMTWSTALLTNTKAQVGLIMVHLSVSVLSYTKYRLYVLAIQTLINWINWGLPHDKYILDVSPND